MDGVFTEFQARHAVKDEKLVPMRWLESLSEATKSLPWVRTLLREFEKERATSGVVPGDPGHRCRSHLYLDLLWFLLASPQVAVDRTSVWVGLAGSYLLERSKRDPRETLVAPKADLEKALWPEAIDAALADPRVLWQAVEARAVLDLYAAADPPRELTCRVVHWSLLFHYLRSRGAKKAAVEPAQVDEVETWLVSICRREGNPPYFAGPSARQYLLEGLVPLGIRAVADLDPAREYLLRETQISSIIRSALGLERTMEIEHRASLEPVRDFEDKMDHHVRQLWMLRAWMLYQEGAKRQEGGDTEEESEELARDHRMATMQFQRVVVLSGSLEGAWGDLEFHSPGATPAPPLIVQVGHHWMVADASNAVLFPRVAHALLFYHRLAEGRDDLTLRELPTRL